MCYNQNSVELRARGRQVVSRALYFHFFIFFIFFFIFFCSRSSKFLRVFTLEQAQSVFYFIYIIIQTTCTLDVYACVYVTNNIFFFFSLYSLNKYSFFFSFFCQLTRLLYPSKSRVPMAMLRRAR